MVLRPAEVSEMSKTAGSLDKERSKAFQFFGNFPELV